MDCCSRYLKIYSTKTRDEATEKMEKFLAGVGVNQTVVPNVAIDYIGQEFRQVCKKQKE